MKLSFLLLLSTLNWYSPAPKISATTTLSPTVKVAIDDDKFPVPAENPQRLFYMQRTANTNTIMYDMNVENGKLNEKEPVKVYWIRYAEKSQKEDLNYIQRKFAYGVITKKVADDHFDVRFVSYKKFPLTLMKAKDGKYHIFATVSDKQIMLERLFVKIEGGSFWLPNVVYVEFKGTDQNTGREIVERFKP